VLALAHLYDRPVHICHVSRKDEIELIARAKARGFQVTCEVCPHHLCLTQDGLPANSLPSAVMLRDQSPLVGGYREVRPRLAAQTDVDALWANLDVIDCFATDHAPHTPAEKEAGNPPPGFPGLEVALSLWLTAAHAGRLTLDDIITRMATNPKRIFNLPDQPETWIEIDPDHAWPVRASRMFSRARWSPYENWRLTGKVTAVHLRGQLVYDGEKVLASQGFGKNVNPQFSNA